MAIFKIGNRRLLIPDDGQVMYNPQSQTIVVRKGNRLMTASIEALGQKFNGGLNVSGAEARRLGGEFLKQQGINVGSLDTFTNSQMADMTSVFDRTGGFSRGAITNPAQLQSKAIASKKNEVITQTVSPSNPQGEKIVSNKTGKISESPSTGEVIRNAGGTQEQARQIAGASVAGQPISEAVATQVGVTPPSKPAQETFDINKFNQAIASNNEAEARRIGQLPSPDQEPNFTQVDPNTLGLSFNDLENAGGEGAQLVAPDGKRYVITPLGTLRPLSQAVEQGAVPPGGAPAPAHEFTPATDNQPAVPAEPAVPKIQFVPQGGGSVAATPQTEAQQGLPVIPNQGLLTDRLTQAVKTETPAPSQTISIDSLQQPKKILQLPQETPQQQPITTDLPELVTQSEKLFTKSPEEIQLEQQQKQFETLTGEFGAKDQRRAQLEQEGGLDEKNQRLLSITNRLRSLNTRALGEEQAATQATATAENRLAPTFAITGEQAAIERQAGLKRRALAIEQFATAAQQQAVQGEIGLAVDLVDRALTAEFEPMEAKLNVQKLRIQAMKDAVERGDVRRTNAINLALKEQERNIKAQKEALKEQKSDRKDIQLLALNAIQNGADDAILKAIQNARSVEEAIAIGSQFILDPLEQAKIESEKALAEKRRREPSSKTKSNELSADALKKLDDIGFEVQAGDTMKDVSNRNQVPEEKVTDEAIKAGDSKDGFFSKVFGGVKKFFTGGQTNEDFVNSL